MRCLLPLAILLVIFAPLTAQADTVNIDASRDNAMYSEDGAKSNGAGEYLFVGNTKDNFPRRSLILFNIAATSPMALPLTR